MRQDFAERAKHRIAVFVLRNRDQRQLRFADGVFAVRRRRRAVEHQRLQPAGETRVQHRGALGAAHGADDALEAVAEHADEMFRRIAETETQERGHRRFIPRARPFHSAATSGSVSSTAPRRCAAFEPRAIEPAERPDGGAANQRRGIVEQPLGFGASARVARIADRDQHIAHKARAADALDRRSWRTARESRHRRAAPVRQAAARATPRAPQASPHGRLGRICSTDRPRGNRRSHRCGCR